MSTISAELLALPDEWENYDDSEASDFDLESWLKTDPSELPGVIMTESPCPLGVSHIFFSLFPELSLPPTHIHIYQ